MMDKVSEKMTKKFDNPIDREEYQNFERLKKWLKNGIDLASKKSVTASNLRNNTMEMIKTTFHQYLKQMERETYLKKILKHTKKRYRNLISQGLHIEKFIWMNLNMVDIKKF